MLYQNATFTPNFRRELLIENWAGSFIVYFLPQLVYRRDTPYPRLVIRKQRFLLEIGEVRSNS